MVSNQVDCCPPNAGVAGSAEAPRREASVIRSRDQLSGDSREGKSCPRYQPFPNLPFPPMLGIDLMCASIGVSNDDV